MGLYGTAQAVRNDNDKAKEQIPHAQSRSE